MTDGGTMVAAAMRPLLLLFRALLRGVWCGWGEPRLLALLVVLVEEVAVHAEDSTAAAAAAAALEDSAFLEC